MTQRRPSTATGWGEERRGAGPQLGRFEGSGLGHRDKLPHLLLKGRQDQGSQVRDSGLGEHPRQLGTGDGNQGGCIPRSAGADSDRCAGTRRIVAAGVAGAIRGVLSTKSKRSAQAAVSRNSKVTCDRLGSSGRRKPAVRQASRRSIVVIRRHHPALMGARAPLCTPQSLASLRKHKESAVMVDIQSMSPKCLMRMLAAVGSASCSDAAHGARMLPILKNW